MIHAPEKERKIDERKLIRDEIKELAVLVDRGRRRIEELQKQLDEPRKLEFSHHALERYKERIENLPNKVIKKIITEGGALEKYIKNGPGRHRLTNNPTVIVVIQDYKVITVMSQRDPEIKLEYLTQYMEYWIDKRCQQEYRITPILPFREYIKTLYK